MIVIILNCILLLIVDLGVFFMALANRMRSLHNVDETAPDKSTSCSDRVQREAFWRLGGQYFQDLGNVIFYPCVFWLNFRGRHKNLGNL